MPWTLSELHALLSRANRPAEVFGKFPDGPADAVEKAFRELVQVAHPDRCPGDPRLASATFQLLEQWRHKARAEIAAGVYGRDDLTEITTRKATYQIVRAADAGDCFSAYECRRVGALPEELRLKLAGDPRDNDLLEREAQALDSLSGRQFPKRVDLFTHDRRRGVILAVTPRGITMAKLREAFPTGLDPRDAAWVFNRILEALWQSHRAGLVNGAVLPGNLWVGLEDHSVMLLEWAYSTPAGEPLTAISGHWRDWYPPEVFAKAGAGPALDIFLAARCMVALLGGDPLTGVLPARVPAAIARFLRACLLPSPARRPGDAGALRENFGELLRNLYGLPVFRRLAIPA